MPSRAQLEIKDWVTDGLTVLKIGILLTRKGIVVPHRTLAQFGVERCGAGRRARSTVRVDDPPAGTECQVDFGRLGLVPDVERPAPGVPGTHLHRLLEPPHVRLAPRHDWLCLTGGAIGQGLPLATGAAVACPDRRVLSRGRRQCDVHPPVAVDAGPRGSRRHNRDLRQSFVCDPEFRTEAFGDTGSRVKQMLELERAHHWTSHRWRRGWVCRRYVAEDAESSSILLERALSEPGAMLIQAVLTS